MLIGSFCHIIEKEGEIENRGMEMGKEIENRGMGMGMEKESRGMGMGMGMEKESRGMEQGAGSKAEGMRVRVRFEAEHPIYLGHFFGNPITPGACLVEIAEELIGHPITQIKGLKFLNTVPPTAELLYTFSPKQENQYSITIIDDKQHITYARFSATYLCGDTDL